MRDVSRILRSIASTALSPLLSMQDHPWGDDPYVQVAHPYIATRCSSAPSTAIDVVKTRIQINPAYKSFNLLTGTRYVIANEGPAALLTGFGPTAVGYLVQGGGKFAGYEFWKKQFTQIAGDQDTAVKYRTAIYLGASSVGECVSPRQSLMCRF